jgi:hypothetical protein
MDFEILILNSIELLGCLNHVITITLQIRYTGCYSPPPKIKSSPEISKEKGPNSNSEQSHVPSLS